MNSTKDKFLYVCSDKPLPPSVAMKLLTEVHPRRGQSPGCPMVVMYEKHLYESIVHNEVMMSLNTF